MIGQVVGNYRIVSELGRGGMGMVYRVEHTQLGRPAALKMLLPQFSADPGIVQRFFNEARAASAIEHPGIVEIFDYGTHADGTAYIVMELLRGESMQQRMQRGPMAPIEAASICAQVAGGLAAAHARNIVHRDLKPDNIFLVPNELMPDGLQVKLLDFGIAKLSDDRSAFKTQTGALIGTPAYMSPEQCMGSPDLDHRTDLYAVGCILFHALTGRPPFVSAQGSGMMIAAHIRDQPPHPRTLVPAIPDDLAVITLRLLEKEPAARFQTALELRAAFAAAGAHVPGTNPGAQRASSAPLAVADGFAATIAPAGLALTAATGPGVPLTTAGASAGQIVTAAPRGSRSKGVWIGTGIAVLGLAGAAAVVAVSRSGDDPDRGTTGSADPG
ncbi:MAG TPA: serine/threonine-protein kinase, partial [Kofleriaceae bacterium]|nr:serine/threonine-protein kinase [Kofleriaceae bacterium]